VIAISFALPEESKDLVRRLSEARRWGGAVVTGRLGKKQVIVVHSGMGMASATERVGAFLEKNAPSIWIAAGFGGGLSPDLAVGEIVVVENFSAPSLMEAVGGLPARRGTLITTRQVVETAEQKKDLARHTGAIVVDMETAAIQRLCGPRGILMLSIRAISDTAGQDLPVPAEVWFNMKTQRPRPGRLVSYLAAHPGRIAPFARFVRGINVARASLTSFLLAALAALPEK